MPPPNKLLAQLHEALAHHQAGRLPSAERLYAQVRRSAPAVFDGWHLGGLAAYQLGKYDEALALLTRALQLSPGSAVCLMRFGVVHLARGSMELAETYFKRALDRDPSLVEAWENRSIIYLRQGRLAEALECAHTALRINPQSAALHERVAALTADTQGFGAALPLMEETTKRFPEHAAGWKNLGLAYATLHEPDAALVALDRALALQPGMLTAMHGRGVALQEAFHIPEAIAAYEAVLALDPSFAEADSGRLLCLNYLETTTPAEVKTAHETFGARHVGAGVRVLPARADAKPLRVAFLSPDLRRHAVASFLEPLLQHLDRSQVEIWLYHDHAITDDVTARLRAHATRWRHVAGQVPSVVEATILADAPDVLIDLAGHTGSSRLPLYARRLAPLQITYLGYPNTTGVAAMDYRFTDALADPEGMTDAFYTEQLVRFAPCAWAYQPPEEAPPVAPPPCLQPGATGVAFGSFNNPAKLTDGTLRRWAAVLAAVPGSRLVLKGHGLETRARQVELLQRCAAHGLDPARVELIGRTQAKASHLDLYKRVDITLDPYPYHGTTTTCEALWMGRPVITLAGKEHRNRVGVSLLTAAGHPEWIAQSDADYTRIAVELASDRARLAAIGAGLRDDLRAGPMLDHAGHARGFERAVRDCWEKTLTAKGR